jgi:hypothetical protein
MCIFERFYRGEKPCSREGGWAGIGLAIVKEMGFVPIQKGGQYGFGRPHSGACPVPGEPRGTALRLAPECVAGAAALGTSQAPWARWGRWGAPGVRCQGTGAERAGTNCSSKRAGCGGNEGCPQAVLRLPASIGRAVLCASIAFLVIATIHIEPVIMSFPKR